MLFQSWGIRRHSWGLGERGAVDRQSLETDQSLDLSIFFLKVEIKKKNVKKKLLYWGMTQLCKCEDQSLDPQHPCQSHAGMETQHAHGRHRDSPEQAGSPD